MSVTTLIAEAQQASAEATAAQQRLNKACRKLQDALDPLVKRALDRVNTDLFQPYRFGRYTLRVSETGEIDIELHELVDAHSRRACGPGILFYGDTKTERWVSELRQIFCRALGLPPNPRLIFGVASSYYAHRP